MSRCFPYPPPGYTLSRADKEALIESIKLQKEREKTKDKEQRKKDKKKEKKEKKNEKKEKRKEKKDKVHQNLDKSDVLPGHTGEKLWADIKNELIHKQHEAEPEQLERSSLTEEHGHPICLNPPSCSSDSTENSNKRKRQCSPEDVNRVHGKIIRIRLSKKPDDSSSSANEQQLCSTSGRVHFPSLQKHESVTHRRQDLCSTSNEPSNIGQGFVHKIDGELFRPASQHIKTVATGKTEIPPVKNLTPMRKTELDYKNLFDNWAPPQLLDASLPDDLDWLFQGKNLDKSAKKKQISGNASMSCSSSQALWPHSQYLQEVDVYALPYTVPI